MKKTRVTVNSILTEDSAVWDTIEINALCVGRDILLSLMEVGVIGQAKNNTIRFIFIVEGKQLIKNPLSLSVYGVNNWKQVEDIIQKLANFYYPEELGIHSNLESLQFVPKREKFLLTVILCVGCVNSLITE